MLSLERISPYTPYSDEWWEDRKGKLTSSKWSCLMGKEGIGVGGETYIKAKVGEKLTGISSERNITTEAIAFGIENEPKSLQYFLNKYQLPMLITNKHLIFDELFSATPDGLLVKRQLGDSYDCETVETKSYATFATHISHCLCNTPNDIKKINPQLYWQVLSQMEFANVIQGNAIFYNPNFKEGEGLFHRVIFKKIDLVKDFKFQKQRMSEVRDKYNDILFKMKNLKA